MFDLDLTNLFLTGIATYGPVVFGLALLLGAVGLPLPTTVLVVTAGILARQGVIDWSAALGVGLAGVVIGDSASYGLGCLVPDRRRLFPARQTRSGIWSKAQDQLKQYGGWAIYLTRFLLTPLAVPTNLIAGSSRYGFRRFLVYDAAGEMTWLLFYGGLGYAGSSQTEIIGQLMADYGGWLGGVLIVGLLSVYWLDKAKLCRSLMAWGLRAKLISF